MNTNSDNPRVGREFQEFARNILSKHFNTVFNTEISIPIGDPPKPHKFDCVSLDGNIIGECKCYTWTETGNIPSAKMGFINEAVFYMSYLPATKKKIVIMKKAIHVKRNETLAEYYCRINGHLLNGITVLELDTDISKLVVVKE